MADLSLLLGRDAARFAPDTRFDTIETAAPMAALVPAAPLPPDPPADPPPDQPPDPIAEAHAAGFAAGYLEGRDEALAQAAADHATAARFTATLTRLDAEHSATLRQRLRDTVVGLCQATIAPLALDMPALAGRIERAAALFARADDQRVIRLNPADLDAVRALIPADWTLLADPALEPGALRIEAATGGAEDGPAQWRQAIDAALASC